MKYLAISQFLNIFRVQTRKIIKYYWEDRLRAWQWVYAQKICIYLNKGKIIRDGRKLCRSWSELVLGNILNITEQREGLNLDCPTTQEEVEMMLVKRGVWAADRASDEKDSNKISHKFSEKPSSWKKKLELKVHLALLNVCTKVALKWSGFSLHIN